tara:strand:+ start:58 stop:384 length:327 start_codon:yes stop_codon:yes gene_type:complete
MKVAKNQLKQLISEEITNIISEENEALCKKLRDDYYDDQFAGLSGDASFNEAMAKKCKWAVDLTAATPDKAAQQKTPAPAVSTGKADMSVEKRLDSIEEKLDQILAKL